MCASHSILSNMCFSPSVSHHFWQFLIRCSWHIITGIFYLLHLLIFLIFFFVVVVNIIMVKLISVWLKHLPSVHFILVTYFTGQNMSFLLLVQKFIHRNKMHSIYSYVTHLLFLKKWKLHAFWLLLLFCCSFF